jgi:hypothetical protein
MPETASTTALLKGPISCPKLQATIVRSPGFRALPTPALPSLTGTGTRNVPLKTVAHVSMLLKIAFVVNPVISLSSQIRFSSHPFLNI